MFTGDEFGDGGNRIANTLKKYNTKAAFFLTGRFYKQTNFRSLIKKLKQDGHYLGAHSNEHLLYADWKARDSLLVTKQQFKTDLLENYSAMKRFGITQKNAPYFLPPFEWYNDSIAAWTKELNLQLINYTPGTLSHADYTTPLDRNYRSSAIILNSIISFEEKNVSGLNGFILLLHIGTHPARKDKFYKHLPHLLSYLKQKGYNIVSLSQLLPLKN